jgi:hypothetical protein
MKRIPLTQGMYVVVDDEDYPRLKDYKWCARRQSGGRRQWYALSHDRGSDGRRFSILMHRLIMNAPPGIEIDHKSGVFLATDPKGLDNRKSNLRLATDSQNARNASRRSDNTSGYKGVSWNSFHDAWSAHIMVGGKRRFIGYFGTAEEAARMYDLWAWLNFGEYARFNFLEEWVRKAA